LLNQQLQERCVSLSTFTRRLKEMDSTTAQATFELSNNITTVSSVDAIFKYNHTQQQELLSAKPWTKE
jgi:replication-associated recombination protein RarA